jgi:hypothetical protein
MAGQTVILELPEAVYRWAERTARATEQAMESVLVGALNTTLPPPLDQVPAEWHEELEALETLSTSALLQIARERLTAAQVRQYDRLLEKHRQGTLTSRERARLTQLRQAADRIMLRRARAYVLLKWRGYSVAEIIEQAE